MNKHKSMKKSNSGLLSLLLVIIIPLAISGCKKDASHPAPELPPQSSFIVDFSDFSSNLKSSAGLSDLKSTETLTNFQTAAVMVAYWNTILSLYTAIPVACFKEAFNHKASYTSANTWEWKYNLSLGSKNISSQLQAVLLTDSVQWKMTISVTGDSLSIDNFVWFTGTSRLDGTQGYWVLNESPASDNPLFVIDWTKRLDLTKSVKYTYVKPDETATGNYIKFGTGDTTTTYNVYYILHQERPIVFDTNIEWNSTSKAGRYNDIDGWHCWDTNRLNINCN
jgi:hypothetical protein